MPLTPEEVLRKRLEINEPEVQAMTKQIDAAMLKRYAGGVFRWELPVRFHGTIATKHAAMARYEAKGWSVRVVHGEEHPTCPPVDYLEFTPKAKVKEAEAYRNK